jgi:DGQHR domain-containing protein
VTTTRSNPPAKRPTLRYAQELRLPALQVRQGRNRMLYSFAIDGKQLPLVATVSRVHRDDNSQIQGYQRPEVLSHIGAIRRYIESTDAMIPNALVIAFDKRVRFEATKTNGSDDIGYVMPGVLVIPLDPKAPEEDRPGWIVDGQQRAAAIREAKVRNFPICVTAFISDSDADQRSQFILVNSTKPLPKGLIYELLPSTSGALPLSLQLRRFPATLLDRLNYDSRSPLHGLIQTPTTPTGVIKDNSILKMLENSLTDGALYRYRDPANGEGDADAMLALLHDYWRAVCTVFPEAWGQPPRRSRLMHGVGIASLGFLMDAIVDRLWATGVPSEEDFRLDLKAVADCCHWTAGRWQMGSDRRFYEWNDLQNTPRDIQLLTNHLLSEYKARVWSRPPR